ncbi:MAG: methyltransferase domain-containing protein [Erysipelotrichaceae bacterium]|nr:methyltransferase domain-containing protein [Erysipelotrichaceae bacterium]
MNKDYLKFTDFEFLQLEDGYHVNSDTALLGKFLKLRNNKTILDIGTGSGALLVYASFFKPEKMVGVDIDCRNIEVAKKNLKTFDNARLYNARIQDFTHEQFDYIVTNPPYFISGAIKKNELCQRSMFDDELKLEELFKVFSRLLKDNGEIFMIYPTIRLQELMYCCVKYKYKIMEMQFVYEHNRENAIRVLLKIKKGSGTNTQIKIKKPINIVGGEIIF